MRSHPEVVLKSRSPGGRAATGHREPDQSGTLGQSLSSKQPCLARLQQAQLTIQDASLLNVPSFVSQPQPSQSLPQQSRAEGPAVDPNWHYR
ncbi:unnamed protein product [Gadus morhua 'NCC']